MLTRTRARSIGWAAILGLCFAFTLALTFRVNAVRSQVRLTERKILALKTEKSLLETEFETRANQQQLRNLNDVEFGYQAPTAGQYLESERQLAMLGKPSGPGAPEMIRVARSDPAEDQQPAASILPAMVNPLTGKALAAEAPKADRPASSAAAPATRLASAKGAAGRGESLADRLGHIEGERSSAAGKVERLSHVERDPVLLKASAKGAAAPARSKADAKKLATVDGKAEARASAKPAAKAAPKSALKVAAKPAPASTTAPRTAAKPAARSAPKTAHSTPHALRVAIDE